MGKQIIFSQFLSGHGLFQAYLKKMGKTDSEECVYCGRKDDALHTFFECDRWLRRKTELEWTLGQITPDNVICVMLESEENWTMIVGYVESILQTKKREVSEDNRRRR